MISWRKVWCKLERTFTILVQYSQPALTSYMNLITNLQNPTWNIHTHSNQASYSQVWSRIYVWVSSPHVKLLEIQVTNIYMVKTSSEITWEITLWQLFRTCALASHTQVLSEPYNKVTHNTALPLELPQAMLFNDIEKEKKRKEKKKKKGTKRRSSVT